MSNSINIPKAGDPRWTVLGLLILYISLGITILGFNRAPLQIIAIVFTTCTLDVVFNYIFKRKFLFPLSGAITGCGLSILVNYSHGMMLPLIPAFFAISSKYIFTYNEKHVFNPALFGVVAGLLLGNDMITSAPSYQWGGGVTIAAFIVTAAVLLFVHKIKRTILILSFLTLYSLQLAIRAYATPDLMPAHMLFLGAFANPAFYLFTFFMITDPATSPQDRKGQFLMAFLIVAIDLWLHTIQSYATLFYAGFIYFAMRWMWLHIMSLRPKKLLQKVKFIIPRATVISLLATLAIWSFNNSVFGKSDVEPGFPLERINSQNAGITTRPSNILEETDPRIQHIAKWLLSVGDAVAVADVNNDGLLDVFLTYTLKDKADRAALYLNRGNFKFERFAIPFLTKHFSNPKENGLPSGALWLDYDNDGDSDLLVMVGYGKSLLLKNLLVEKGKLEFTDISKENGFDEHTISLTANAFDMNQDGKLDILIGNALPTYLPDYDSPTPLNIFDLPKAQYDGDRRMFNFMHRTWHNAANGGENYLFINSDKGFKKTPPNISGLSGNRWTLDIGTGDFNGDGWTDLYLANDFGPDELFINQEGKEYKRIKGKLAHHIGRDVYKSMNASVADLDGNGELDIYTSNVHHKLQAEGSQLWLNDGTLDENGYKSFEDMAVHKNALNEHRFGWGAAVGDLNLDGLPDIIQANGMVGNDYDPIYEGCPDYWYWNEKIALTNPDEHGYADNWADLRGRCIFPDEPDRAYLNLGNSFIDVAAQIGLNRKGNSRGVALADMDNDGDLDVLISDQFEEVGIYKNDIDKKNWIGLDLQGDGKTCNKDAIGTKVEILSQIREVNASNGFSSQGDKRLLFGLGNFQGKLVDIKIHWCGERKPKQITLPINQYHKISQ